MSELETSTDQGVGIITFNRPKALNAVNHHVMAELLATAEAFDPQQNRWEAVAPLAQARDSFGAVPI